VSRSEPSPKTAVSTSSGRGETRDVEVLWTCGDAGQAPRGNDIPVPESLRRVEMTTRCKTPWRPCRSRERAAARRLVETLGRRWEGQHAADPEKRERGRGLVARSTAERCKKPRSGQTQGGSDAVTWLNPRPACRIRAVCSIPGGEAKPERAEPKTRGVRRSRGRTAPRGEKPRRGTPRAEPG
jgi:hypothetical protein